MKVKMSDFINIRYVHGYLGHGNGHSSELIRREFQSHGISVKIDAPQFPVTEPKKMHELLHTLIQTNKYDCVVASSLGAFYVMQIPEIKKILVNIALPDNLRMIMYSDRDNNPELTESFLDCIESEKESFFSNMLTENLPQETFILYGLKDDIAPNEAYLKQYYNDQSRIFHVDMAHKLDPKGASKVVDIIICN
ncbi:Uncharacterised protein family (UPF0227) [Lachnospiraceae bacterium]|nr:Uncharacterised protein family (UPF0227) [Lachnospiraceae bacterium]